jgi:hypothetical protein
VFVVSSFGSSAFAVSYGSPAQVLRAAGSHHRTSPPTTQSTAGPWGAQDPLRRSRPLPSRFSRYLPPRNTPCTAPSDWVSFIRQIAFGSLPSTAQALILTARSLTKPQSTPSARPPLQIAVGLPSLAAASATS